jgi:diacylglycerol kinase family enzyme
VKAFLVLNPHSGSLASTDFERSRAKIAAACEANGLAAEIAVASGGEITDAVQRALSSQTSAGQAEFRLVVVGGGDGSVSAAASALVGREVPLGILPLGAFNHFARDLGIPLDPEAAIATVAKGQVKLVDVGEVNGCVFLNNSSLGIYPHLVAERRRYRRHGLAKWGAAAVALCRVLWRLPRPSVRVLAPGRQSERRTPCLFVGNNMYQFDAFAAARRRALDRGELCVYIADRQSRAALLRLAVRAVLGRLEPGCDFTLARLEGVEIRARRHRLRVALDGESMMLRPPLRYRIRPRALRVVVPAPGRVMGAG